MSGTSALVLIDLQKAIDDPGWGVRNNPFAEARGGNSKYRTGQPLHDFKPETAPLSGEAVLGKATCNAFARPGLRTFLYAA